MSRRSLLGDSTLSDGGETDEDEDGNSSATDSGSLSRGDLDLQFVNSFGGQ